MTKGALMVRLSSHCAILNSPVCTGPVRNTLYFSIALYLLTAPYLSTVLNSK